MTNNDINKFKQFLKLKKLKYTSERKKILEGAYKYPTHFQPEDLLFTMRKNGQQVSKATIYRTIPVLLECELIRKIHINDKQSHYEYIHDNIQRHYLICTNCGNIIKFENDKIDRILEDIGEKNNFVIQKYIVKIEGYCQDCKFAMP